MNAIFLVIPTQIWAACVGGGPSCVLTLGFWKQLPLPDRQAVLPPRTLLVSSPNPQILLETSKLSQRPSHVDRREAHWGTVFPGLFTPSLSGVTSWLDLQKADCPGRSLQTLEVPVGFKLFFMRIWPRSLQSKQHNSFTPQTFWDVSAEFPDRREGLWIPLRQTVECFHGFCIYWII